MPSRLFRFLLLALGVCLAGTVLAETAEEKAAREERVKARLAEHAHRKATQAAAKAEVAPAVPIPHAATATTATTPVDGAAAKPAPEEVTTLPRMEVRNSRITELDLQIRKLEKDISREQKKMKSSDLDQSLNDAKSAKKFSLFGGKSTEQRESVAAERVSLMEAERDILEAMKQNKTPAELALLQKQVDDLRIVRRNLDVELR
jgi:hypothetical protein